jgi:cyclopropane fatty-acyl-phospholipid synthase-like methyltransferase
MKKWLYEIVYRLFPADMIFGSTSKIEDLARIVVQGRIPKGTAITLGCGEGRETIYLARQGFEVTGLDFSPTAIKKARRRARAAGLEIPFIVDDLTNLRQSPGTFDLVLDFGAFNDLSQKDRDRYMRNVLPMTHPGGSYVMFCFDRMLAETEMRERFSPFFQIEILHQVPGGAFPGIMTVYSMTRGIH